MPFQAVSLKDLSSNNDHHIGHSLGGHLTTGGPGGCHTLHSTSGIIGTVDLETVNSSPGNSSSCLRASNYSRPYDIFPVNVAIDATLRRTGTSIGVSGVTGHEHQSFQVSKKEVFFLPLSMCMLHFFFFFLTSFTIIEKKQTQKMACEPVRKCTLVTAKVLFTLQLLLCRCNFAA